MMELVDMRDLGSRAVTRWGSSPHARTRITEIKAEFPYTMKEFVQSPDKVEARKTELQEQIDQLTDILAAYNEKIAEMLR